MFQWKCLPNINMSALEKLDLDFFETWSTKALKTYLAVRNKSIDGSFKELASASSWVVCSIFDHD